MFADIERFVTRMKLEELRVQRVQLRAAYDDLERRAGEAAEGIDRLRVLFEGLQEIKFAGQTLHPDVANLDTLLYDAGASEGDLPETVFFWQDRLERELAQGRLRAEFVYVFGALLQQFTEDMSTRSRSDRTQIKTELIAATAQPAVPSDYESFLTPLIKAVPGTSLAKLDLKSMLSGYVYLNEIAHQFTEDIFRSSRIRQQAKLIAEDPIMINELADSMRLMFNRLYDWQWPSDGVPVMLHQSGGKWRVFLDEDFPTAVFIRYLAYEFEKIVHLPDRSAYIKHLMRLKRLISLNAPDVIKQNEYRIMQSAWESEFPDIWNAVGIDLDAPLDDQINMAGAQESIIGQRLNLIGKIDRAANRITYQREGYETGENLVLKLVNAEVRLWQAAFKDRPLYVLKFDLKDFYPSISHEMMLFILEQLSVKEEDRRLVAQILQTPIQSDEGVTIARRGLPNARLLSHALSEVILFLLDEYLYQMANVEIIRVVDDVTVLAASAEDIVAVWEAAHTFCEATGLAINMAKSGAVCIGGEKPDGLPESLPGWKLIQLQEDGEWIVNQMAFDNRLAAARQQVAQAESVIGKVEAYNRAVRGVMADLALGVRLGTQYRDRVRSLMANFHNQFDGERSIISLIGEIIRRDFLGDEVDIDIPEAWFYFPITAGGLGILQPMIDLASYAQSDQQFSLPRIPEDRPEDWQRTTNDWHYYYQYWLPDIKPTEPQKTTVMETLVDDFIQRGGQMSGKTQKDLGAYWRWVLYTYGPQIIEQFGSFRFLITELVPLQLILQGRTGRDTQTSGVPHPDDRSIPF